MRALDKFEPDKRTNGHTNLSSYQLQVSLVLILISHHDATYAFAKEFASKKDEDSNVPQILHFLWVGKPIPEKYLDAIIGFEKTNTDYEVRVLNNFKILPWQPSSSSDLLLDW